MTAFDPFAVASQLIDCICAQLKDAGRSDEARWADDAECCIRPGAGPAAWEDCCKGQLTITLLPGFPTNTFPNQDTTPMNGCGAPTQTVSFEITALRCVCVSMDDDGRVPCTCEKREQDAANIMSDLTAVLAGISCCFESDDFEDTEWVLSGWRLVGPDGGCGGVVATLSVELDSPCCTPLTPPTP